MKIAIIGNLNNNGFALLRYFRDLGYDAHLLLYSNDGVGDLSHFSPEADAWYIERWISYIHRMQIKNCPSTLIGQPDYLSIYTWPLALLKKIYLSLFKNINTRIKPYTKKQILIDLGDYDKYIGMGYAPAIFDAVGKKLNIFAPYAMGIDFYKDPQLHTTVSSYNSRVKRFYQIGIAKQIKGIKNVDRCIGSDTSLTFDAYSEIGVNPIRLTYPMVYNREDAPGYLNIDLGKFLNNHEKDAHLSVVMHSRLLWVRPENISEKDWVLQNKNSDWVIRAIAQLKEVQKYKILLIIFDYGIDAKATWDLCVKLNIHDTTIILPKLDRKEIMAILKTADVGVGEFYNVKDTLWGGTGWEILASGLPLLQGYNFSDDDFKVKYGYPPPPMLKVKCQNDIYFHLERMIEHPDERREIGKKAQVWFNMYNGIGLAKQWLELLE